ncbi:terminase large subunit [Mycobacterium phage BirdsNest]|uniref:Terminase n=1 Tax=Mycobacterium phage BirdsNest TaxID=2686231 RepID=A0A6B9L772_9CAUD|nr:terminase large subunit [Mycobacterium phage BirdsNest]QHB37310.1 terminase [Mycobacterium phage BirdsNest]
MADAASPFDPERVARWIEPDGPVPDVWGTEGEFDSAKAALIFEQAKDWPPEQMSAMLRALRAAETRARVKKVYQHPADIAAAILPDYRLTPAIELISEAIETVLHSPKQLNLQISMPPQEGKSTLAAQWTVIRALQINANRRIILATYADALAEAHSRAIRNIIDSYGSDVTDPLTGLPVEDLIGLKLAYGANKVSMWSVEGGAGGLLAAGIGSTITGMSADLLIVDDPFKNSQEADSKAHREKIDAWFSAVARTRLAPDASIIMIQTRWHPEDLAGKVIAGERTLDRSERSWRIINIPAIAEKGIRDSLRREPGTPMVSARDTPEAKRNFPLIRKQVGERTWYALYQGNPTNPAGGIFQRAWFDPRLPGPPSFPIASVVGVDPADSGEGDEAGIIGGMISVVDKRPQVALTHDRSGQYTSDQWAKVAVTLALEIGARVLAVEAYQTSETYVQVVRRAYKAIHDEAVAKRRGGNPLTPIEQRALRDIPPFQIRKWRGATKADAVARAGGLSQSFETGRAKVVEFALSVFEEQAADWQAGQHQPDRVAAAIIVHDTLMELVSGQMHVATPPTKAAAKSIPPPPAWMRRKIG